MSESYEQNPFSDTIKELVENPEQRCPLLLLLDTSGSMQGDSIRQLNEGLVLLRDELHADSLASKRVEVAIVTFGPSKTECDFGGIASFNPPTLVAANDTPMGHAIEHGLSLLSARKQAYRANGIPFYRPWVFLITDGGPTDSVSNAKQLIAQGENSKAFSFFSVGVEGANMEVLQALNPAREPLKLKGLRFRDLFLWLSSSLSSVSKSNPGDSVVLPDPTGPKGWATVG